MDGLILENFRCFRAHCEIPLKPLTFLIGENSTGKTSFLSAIKVAWEIAFLRNDPNFNDELFKLGTFDQIVSDKRLAEFKIGCWYSDISEIQSDRKTTKQAKCEFEGSFEKSYLEPILKCINLELGEYSLKTERDKKPNEEKAKFKVCLLKNNEELLKTTISGIPRFPPWSYIQYCLMESYDNTVKADKNNGNKVKLKGGFHIEKSELDKIYKILRYFDQHGNIYKPIPFAPIRAKPKRTYDEFSELQSSSGDNSFASYARLSATNEPLKADLDKNIMEYANNSGLFKSLSVRKLGTSSDGPIQVNVRIGNKFHNLIDVGYGVSQILPILIDCHVKKNAKLVYLLQQPEVHLHPKAQAELGTFFTKLVNKNKLRFVIETHSDYIIDRIRSDIRRDTVDHISPDDLSILYFQRKGNEVIIHEIKVDENGNLLNVPKGYREFFLTEHRQLLGI